MENAKLKSQASHPFEGFIVALILFGLIGYVMYFIDSYTSPERAPSSIPQRVLQQNFLATQPEVAKPTVDFNKIAPTEVSENEKPELVAAKIADRGLSQFFSSAQFKESKMGKMTDEVKENVRADVQVQTHRFSARLEALQGQACLSYSGYLDAEIKYSPIHQFIDFEVKNDLSTHSRLFLQSKKDSLEIQNLIGFRFSF